MKYIKKQFNREKYIDDLHEKYYSKLIKNSESGDTVSLDWVHDHLFDCICESANIIEEIINYD